MGLAKPETCPHPTTRWSTEVEGDVKLLGFYRCRRCGSEVELGRTRTLRISERVELAINDPVSIAAVRPGMHRDKGRFKYGDEHGNAAVITEEGWRFVRPNMVKRIKRI